MNFALLYNIIYFFRESGVEADITLDNLMVKNLATFETRNIHVDILDLNMQIELFVPLLRVSQTYSKEIKISDVLVLFLMKQHSSIPPPSSLPAIPKQGNNFPGWKNNKCVLVELKPKLIFTS